MLIKRPASSPDAIDPVEGPIFDYVPPCVALTYTGDVARLRISWHDRKAVWGLSLWLACWGLGLVAVVWKLIEGPDRPWLALPFVLLAFGLGGYALLAMAARAFVLEFRPGQMVCEEYSWRWLVRRIELPRLAVREFITQTISVEEDGDKRTYCPVFVDGLGPRVTVYATSIEFDAQALAGLLNRLLEQAQPTRDPRATWLDGPHPQAERIVVESAPLPPGLDLAWTTLEGADVPTWQRTWRPQPGRCVAALFVTIFWNAIISFLAAKVLFGGDLVVGGLAWVAIALFLVPFGLIGAALVVGTIAEFTVGWRQSTFWLNEDAVLLRWRHGPIGGTKRVELPQIVHLERRDISSLKRSAYVQIPERAFELAFMKPTGRAALTIGDLTEGEARWLGQELVRAVPRWSVPRE